MCLITAEHRALCHISLLGSSVLATKISRQWWLALSAGSRRMSSKKRKAVVGKTKKEEFDPDDPNSIPWIKELFEKNIITGSPELVISTLEPIENVYEVGPNYPSKTPTPERDTENFPNVPLAKECPPVVMHFIPRSWFEFFYPKTGVSGGWVFLGGLVIFLLSKEIWVIEHSFYNGLSLLIIVWYGYTRFWPKAVEWGTEKQELEMIKIQYIYDKNVWDLRTQLEREERVRDEARAQTLLFEAKRENVALQLETCFRERQMLVYNEVKRRLDYQVEVQMSESRIKHQHMTNWIIAQVNQEITPELEAKVLQQCVADLRTIAVRFQE